MEMYSFLRSPYSSIVFDRCVKMCRDSGVRLVVRPVLPMVMRGMPISREKGLHIFFDVAREARAQGLDWGDFADPLREPVRRAYSLFPWAQEQGKGTALLRKFFQAAFADGINSS